MIEYLDFLENPSVNILLGFETIDQFKDGITRGFYNSQIYEKYRKLLGWEDYKTCLANLSLGFQFAAKADAARKLSLKNSRELEKYYKKSGKSLKSRSKEFFKSIENL